MHLEAEGRRGSQRIAEGRRGSLAPLAIRIPSSSPFYSFVFLSLEVLLLLTNYSYIIIIFYVICIVIFLKYLKSVALCKDT